MTDPAFLGAVVVLACGLVVLSVIDLRTRRLPDRIVGPLTVTVVAMLALAGDGTAFARALACGLLTGLALAVVNVAAPEGLGMGDVKLSFVLAATAGWCSWITAVWGVVLGAALGAIGGMVSGVLAGESVRSRTIAFAPALAAGTLLAILGSGRLSGLW